MFQAWPRYSVMNRYESVWYHDQELFLEQLHDLYAEKERNPSLCPYGRSGNEEDEAAFPVFQVAAMYGLFPGADVLMPVAIVMSGVFDTGRHSISFFGCRSPCRLDTAQPCRSRGRACLARKGARGRARAPRSSPPEQADSHARAGQVLQEERRCNCGTSGRHRYSFWLYAGLHNISSLLPPQVRNNWRLEDFARRAAHRTWPVWGLWHPVVNGNEWFVPPCRHVDAGHHSYAWCVYAGRHSFSLSTHRFPDFAIADCEKKDADVQSQGRLLGPAHWQRECPTATQHAQAHEVPVRCLGLVFGWCVVDLVCWQDAKANSDKPTQPVPTDPTTPTKIPKKNKAKKDTGKK